HARGDVVVDEVGHPEQHGRAVAGGQLHPDRPFRVGTIDRAGGGDATQLCHGKWPPVQRASHARMSTVPTSIASDMFIRPSPARPLNSPSVAARLSLSNS